MALGVAQTRHTNPRRQQDAVCFLAGSKDLRKSKGSAKNGTQEHVEGRGGGQIGRAYENVDGLHGARTDVAVCVFCSG